MTYLDYLLTHSHEELPPAVRAEISAEDYHERQRLARRLVPPPALPATLQNAYRQRVHASAPRQQRRGWWVAAAGWILALALGAGWALNYPSEQLAVQPTPVAGRTDTLTQIVVDTVILERERLRYVSDTVFLPGAPPPPARIVVVHDTVYRTQPPTYARQSAPVNRQSLKLLVASRGDDTP